MLNRKTTVHPITGRYSARRRYAYDENNRCQTMLALYHHFLHPHDALDGDDTGDDGGGVYRYHLGFPNHELLAGPNTGPPV